MKKPKKGIKRSTLARKAKIKRLSPAPLSFPWAPPFGPALDIVAGESLGDPLSDPLAAVTAALRAGRPEEAFSLCERFLAAEPDNADALNLAGVTPPTGLR